jgi:putative ABC transport system permease protein
VWRAVFENSSLIVATAAVLGNEFGPPGAPFSAGLGDRLTMRTKNGSVINKTIAGILDTQLIAGLFMHEGVAAREFGVVQTNQFLFEIADGADTETVAKNIERTFFTAGMQTTAIRTAVEDITRTMNQFFSLFEAFMALGLVIGIAALGIITIRSVHERRQEIGMMRAIGYRRRMVLWSFLIETSFVAILGIVIGTVLGIVIGYNLWVDGFEPEGFEFFINWPPILVVGAVALGATLLSVIPASRKAARVPPAEALRYKD